MFDKAIQFLKDHKEIALATCEGNLPKLRIFQIMKQEGHVLYFATSAQKAVYRELRQNPNVEILAYADNISVRCSGMVNFNVEDEVKRWIYENNPVLPRLYTSYDQMEYFCLPIAEMDSSISTSLQAKFAIQRENCQTCLSNPERKQTRPKVKLDKFAIQRENNYKKTGSSKAAFQIGCGTALFVPELSTE